MANELHYTVKPGQENLITFLGEASGAYLLYEDDPKTHLKLFADDAGIVQVHVQPKIRSQYVKLALEGSSRSHYFHLRAASGANDEYPFHTLHSASPSGSDTRPALSVEEAQNLRDRAMTKAALPKFRVYSVS